jgi:hypothetical protein
LVLSAEWSGIAIGHLKSRTNTTTGHSVGAVMYTMSQRIAGLIGDVRMRFTTDTPKTFPPFDSTSGSLYGIWKNVLRPLKIPGRKAGGWDSLTNVETSSRIGLGRNEATMARMYF